MIWELTTDIELGESPGIPSLVQAISRPGITRAELASRPRDARITLNSVPSGGSLFTFRGQLGQVVPAGFRGYACEQCNEHDNDTKQGTQ